MPNKRIKKIKKVTNGQCIFIQTQIKQLIIGMYDVCHTYREKQTQTFQVEILKKKTIYFV